ncbi:GNAT family N-acetyltransferase [Psychrobacillus vulpis]|uniref:GNAT family N-acetyltransferase n=1 Tax=Psychrobacillus vulpis TaxID=2325572 RepID=A0A544TQZ3_9BACI|nr:GNAT family N-acetyltransferase [Psychrobacillus vulpis]TQR19860.1 GNAT family N-acetyltransferase [Psychrobacillus vulpis]
MVIVYETERLCLCVFEESHLESSKQFWGNEEVMVQCNGASPHDVLLKVIQAYRKCHEINGLSVYAVKDKETDEIIGASGFNIVGPLKEVELIYHFRKSSWGKGFATEAANACLDLAKNNGLVQIVTASASLENEGSLKILEKIGFSYKGMKWFDDTEQEEPYYEYTI